MKCNNNDTKKLSCRRKNARGHFIKYFMPPHAMRNGGHYALTKCSDVDRLPMAETLYDCRRSSALSLIV